MTNTNVISSEITRPPVGQTGRMAGAFRATWSQTDDAGRRREASRLAYKRVCCKTCSGKGCVGRCRF
jgi:hypothetical protein